MSAGVELLIDGDLICLACQLVDPLCERGPIVACEAKSVSLRPASLSDDARAEIFLNDVTVEGPAGPNLRNDKKIVLEKFWQIFIYYPALSCNTLFFST